MINWRNFLTAGSHEEDEVGPEQMRRVIDISQQLLQSLYLFNREGVWKHIAGEIRKLFDCELATLFLVDEDDPEFLILTAQEPLTADADDVRLRIESKEHGGLTAHAASRGITLAFDEKELRESLFAKKPNPGFLASGKCHSALYTPLKNRKGRLIGLLRINNKNMTVSPQHAPFTAADKSVIELLAAQIVVHLENASAFETMGGVINDVQKSEHSTAAIKAILKRSVRLLDAGFGKLAIWSRSRKRLEIAGEWHADSYDESRAGEEIEARSVLRKLWKQATETEERYSQEELLNLVVGDTDQTALCRTGSRSFTSTIIVAHGQPIGVLHLESPQENDFDDLDRQVLRAFAENVAVGIQSIDWQSHDTKPQQPPLPSTRPYIGEAEGLYQSIAANVPIPMWRKDTNGRFLWVNQRFCEIDGRPREEIIGKTDIILYPVELAENFRRGDQVAMDTGEFEDPEEEHRVGGKKSIRIHVIKRRVTDVLGRTVGTQGMFLDVTADPYRRLFLEAPVAFFELDEQFRIRHVNETMCDLVGYSEKEMESHPISEFVPPDGSAATEELFRDQLSSDVTKRPGDPVNLLHKNGKAIPAFLSRRRIPNRAGTKMGGLLCAVREIGTAEEIAQALRDPDPRYLARIRELQLPVFCLNKELRITFANPAYLHLEGVEDFEAIKEQTDYDRYKDKGRPFAEDSRKVLDTESVIDKVELHPFPDGSERLVRVLKFPQRNSNADIIGVQAVFWELADQEKAQDELRRALDDVMDEYRQIFRDVSEGLFQANYDGKFIGANPAMCKLLGYESEEELLRQPNAGRNRFLNEADRKSYYRQVADSHGEPVVMDYQLRQKYGSPIWVSETVRCVSVKGAFPRAIGIVEDITRRHQDAEAKEKMLTMLAHQLRSPVQQSCKRAESLVNQLDPDGLLGRDHVPAEVLQAAIVRGLTRKTKAVAWSIDLLSRLAQSDDVGNLKLSSIPARRLIKMAREATRDIELIGRNLGRLKPEGVSYPEFGEIEVLDQYASDSPHIRGDADLIEQCVGNLIENAFKYSRPKSTIRLVFELSYRSVTLRVMNRPLPKLEIDQETASLCREKDWRSAGAKSLNVDGTGIGLWLSDRIMIAHKGRLDVEPTGEGGWNEFALSFSLMERDSK